MNIWKLYKNAKIIPEKNFKVDALETYLATLTTETITGVDSNSAPQRIKHDLNLLVKINKSQNTLDFFDNANNYNYMSIKNDDEANPTYYFIMKKTWIAENTIGLVLVMDTVNTFTAERSSFTISNRTLVHREHKDRIVKGAVQYSPLRLPIIPLRNKEYRVSTMPRAESYFATVEEGDIILRTYNADGDLISTRTCQTFGYEYNADYNDYLYFAVEEGVMTYFVRGNTYRTDYSQGKYMTIEITGYIDEIIGLEEKLLDALRVGREYKRIVDYNSEGLFPLKLHNSLEDKQVIPNLFNWYLIYKNHENINPTDFNQVNAVDCFLCADSPVTLEGLAVHTETLSGWDTSKHYLITPISGTPSNYQVRNMGVKINYNSTDYISYELVRNDSKIPPDIINIDCYYVGGVWHADILYSNVLGTYGPSLGERKTTINNISSIDFTNGSVIYKNTGQNDPFYIISLNDTVDISSSTAYTLEPIEVLDRTDSKLIKIIKLPYCPVAFDEENKVLGGGVFEYSNETKLAKLSNLNATFSNDFDLEINPLEDLLLGDITNEISVNASRNAKYESKLYHSDYRTYKFVYDSFAIEFDLEKVDLSLVDRSNFNVVFKMTTTINSKFMFTFPKYKLKYAETDFDNILVIARNNEIPLYNNAYITYLRTGYNYDVKSKNRQEFASTAGTILSAVGTMASFGLGGPFGVTAGVGFFTQTAQQAISTANTIAQSEQNLEAKQRQLKAQATNVSGSDDVDLMSEYCDNKAKMCLYNISPKMQQAMFDVFYYTGYISGVMKTPDFTSRYWFNFVSCDLQLETVVNIPDNCLENLKERYKSGITVMHAHSGVYDWNREKENWENSLID